jgi:hypothetical protein
MVTVLEIQYEIEKQRILTRVLLYTEFCNNFHGMETSTVMHYHSFESRNSDVEKNESFVGKFHYCRSVEIYKPV